MNKKEVAEIKKQFSPSNCAITRICGCYVDAEKERKTELKEAFLSLPEEEMFKYFDIFKKTLSGTIGKNLINLDFPLEQELSDGAQTFLLKLRDSKLKDDMLLDEFYDRVIAHYSYGENYYIILIHAAYDIPGKASDGDEMFDSSEYVDEHLLCSICPVKLSRPDSVTTKKQIALWIEFVTGLWKFRKKDSCSLLLLTETAISTVSSTIQKIQKNYNQNL